jgi:hypothetical protein
MEDKFDTAATTLQTIVAAAAEADGEFMTPLSADNLAALRAAVDAQCDAGRLDEARARARFHVLVSSVTRASREGAESRAAPRGRGAVDIDRLRHAQLRRGVCVSA